MRLRLLLRKLTISAPQMRVLTQRPWYVRLAPYFLVALASAGVTAGWYAWSGAAGNKTKQQLEQELAESKLKLQQLYDEHAQLERTARTATSQIDMEQAARSRLTQEMKTLEADNARLREELAFFERSISANQAVLGLTLSGARIQVVQEGVYQLRVMVAQSGKINANFNGQLQLHVTGQQNGKTVQLILPEPIQNSATAAAGLTGKTTGYAVSPASAYQLNFRHYQRLEIYFALPANLQLKTVQAKVFDGKTIRLTQQVSL
ncbi:DUF6776 family protein [Parvibium lacunae]|uniref:Uncharacterized protein n=1 Tax=Parvibium lacunae TaxID=1888893 RepID=A0A368L237_9BURK|nr:DUF6776 family protein [Parvibium lacunae]RCS57572.1 hypothetical protein DU000_09030 [Parvibium lacunae]